MLGIPLRYLLKHPRAAADLIASPVETWTRVQDEFVFSRELRGPRFPYQANRDWEAWLHKRIDAPWPCEFREEFAALWSQVISELESKGIRPGPESFAAWNDGDAGLVRTTWCLVRHTRPKRVVETGVAHGVTSRFILESLRRNGRGRLWSIDLPPIEKPLQQQVGVAVPASLASEWTYIKGSSRLKLPKLLAELGEIGLFVHDSLHSERNVRFELDRAWTHLSPGGAVVVDDVDANRGFHSFTETFSGHSSAVCEAEPIRPDGRRFNKKGLFGIILKNPARALAA